MSLAYIPSCPRCGGDIGGEVVDCCVGQTPWILEANDSFGIECPSCGADLWVNIYVQVDVHELSRGEGDGE